MKTSVKAFFTLTGKFNPNEITSLIDLNPTRTWRYGDLRQGTQSSYKNDGWQFSVKEGATLDLSEKIIELLNIIHPYYLILKKIYKRLEVEAEMACSVFIEDDQYPSIHLDSKILRMISDLDAEIDIDIL